MTRLLVTVAAFVGLAAIVTAQWVILFGAVALAATLCWQVFGGSEVWAGGVSLGGSHKKSAPKARAKKPKKRARKKAKR